MSSVVLYVLYRIEYRIFYNLIDVGLQKSLGKQRLDLLETAPKHVSLAIWCAKHVLLAI